MAIEQAKIRVVPKPWGRTDLRPWSDAGQDGQIVGWYVLSTAPNAKVALGLSGPSSPAALRHAIEDGSIETLVQWREVRTHETLSVPAGTIHALGAGLVVAENQQRSDTIFRLFDFGRNRDLHIDLAVAVATCIRAGGCLRLDPQPL